MEDYRMIEIEEDQEDLVHEEEEDYMDEEEEEVEEMIPVQTTSPSVPTSITDVENLLQAVVISDSLMNGSNDAESLQEKPEKKENDGSDGGKEELDRGEIDGLFCPICFEAWTSGGDHQICCLPCGHIYGSSCLKKWLQRSPNSGKCPQCKGLCTLNDIRVLYAARLCVADEMLHNKVKSLEAKCATLEQKGEETVGHNLCHLMDLMSTTLQNSREAVDRPIWVDEIIGLMDSMSSNLDTRLARLEARVARTETRLDHFDTRIDTMASTITELRSRDVT